MQPPRRHTAVRARRRHQMPSVSSSIQSRPAPPAARLPAAAAAAATLAAAAAAQLRALRSRAGGLHLDLAPRRAACAAALGVVRRELHLCSRGGGGGGRRTRVRRGSGGRGSSGVRRGRAARAARLCGACRWAAAAGSASTRCACPPVSPEPRAPRRACKRTVPPAVVQRRLHNVRAQKVGGVGRLGDQLVCRRARPQGRRTRVESALRRRRRRRRRRRCAPGALPRGRTYPRRVPLASVLHKRRPGLRARRAERRAVGAKHLQRRRGRRRRRQRRRKNRDDAGADIAARWWLRFASTFHVRARDAQS